MSNPAIHPTTNIPAAVCPRCGSDNGCAAAHERPAESCWCMTFTVPGETLARIKQEYPPGACLCESCMTALIEEDRTG